MSTLGWVVFGVGVVPCVALARVVGYRGCEWLDHKLTGHPTLRVGAGSDA